MQNHVKNILSLYSEIAPKTTEYYKLQLDFYKKNLSNRLKLAFTYKEKVNLIQNEITEINESITTPSEIKDFFFMDIQTAQMQLDTMKQMLSAMPNFIRQEADTESLNRLKTLLDIDLLKLINFEPLNEEDENKIENALCELCNAYGENEEVGEIEKEIFRCVCELIKKGENEHSIDNEDFGRILIYKYQRDILIFLHEVLYKLETENENFVENIESTTSPNLKEIIISEIPNDYIEIKGNLSFVQITHFFTFLTQETNGDETPFLTEEEHYQLLQYGFTVPNIPRTPLIKLKLSNKKTKAIIYYAMYKLFLKHNLNSHSKELYAKFLKYNFKEFSNLKLLNIKKAIRGKKPEKLYFEIDKYLPN